MIINSSQIIERAQDPINTNQQIRIDPTGYDEIQHYRWEHSKRQSWAGGKRKFYIKTSPYTYLFLSNDSTNFELNKFICDTKDRSE